MMKKIFISLLSFFIALPVMLPVGAVYAASANVYVSPGSANVTNGNTLTVDVRENSGSEPVNAATISLTYPAGQFDFISINNSSAFSIAASSSGGGGNVQFSRGALPAVSGDQSIATVSFKAKVSSGSGTVAISSARVISATSNTNIAGGTSNGTYNFQAPPAPAAKPAAKPAAASAPAPVNKDTTPPAISNVQVTDITATSAAVNWTTSEPATSVVSYGLDENYGLSATDNSLVTDHKVTLNSDAVKPATLYHFMVKSADAAGNNASGDDQTFTTKGVSIGVTITDQNNKAVSGAKITVAKIIGTTNRDGQANLDNVPTGKQQLTVSYHGQDTEQDVQINLPDSSGKSQNFSIQINVTARGWKFWTMIGLAVVILAGAIMLILRRRSAGPPPAPADTMPVTFTPLPSSAGAPYDPNSSRLVNPADLQRK